ncbi:hypothetical protein [Coleofasciculus sp. H7-2]|uniref:hypothetical protein n=1 Tax=Coleofasciculus sp. H7-2 TaxID=3351545 RepID=UPI003670FFE7
MRTNRKIALLASTALLLGGGFTIAQKSSVTTPEQLVSMCRGGGYPHFNPLKRCDDPLVSAYQGSDRINRHSFL